MYVGSYLKVIDNTGGCNALCIKIFSNSKLGKPGNVVLIAVKSVLTNKKIAYSRKKKIYKGTVRRCLLIRISYFLKREGNYILKFKTSGVALIGRWDLPIGSRVFGPIQHESRIGKYIRISMLAEGTF